MEFPTSSSFFHFRFKKLIHFIVYSVKSIIETVLEKSIIENLLLQNLKVPVASRPKLSYEPQKQLG